MPWWAWSRKRAQSSQQPSDIAVRLEEVANRLEQTANELKEQVARLRREEETDG